MKSEDFKKMVVDAINAFAKQGKKSTRFDGGSSCAYLSKSGDCCIVGHMMDSDETRMLADKQDDTSIFSLFKDGFPWTQQFNEAQILFLTDLQNIHDDIVPHNEKVDVIYAITKMKRRTNKEFCEDVFPEVVVSVWWISYDGCLYWS